MAPLSATRDRRPLPLQIRDEIWAAIQNDGSMVGERLPSEAELARRFAVGRTTVREALKMLEHADLIEVRPGRGRFVSAVAGLRAERPVTYLESVTDMMHSLGYSVTNRVISVAETEPCREEADSVKLDHGAKVIRLERLRLHGKEPFIYGVDVFPTWLVGRPASMLDWSGSLLELLARYGHRFVTSLARISAVTLPSDVGRRNNLRANDPWLLITETCVSDSGEHLLFSKNYHRSDVFAFNVIRRRVDSAT